MFKKERKKLYEYLYFLKKNSWRNGNKKTVYEVSKLQICKGRKSNTEKNTSL